MTKKAMGRKKIEFDWDRLDKFLMSGCSGAQSAAAVGISFDTLNRRCQSEKKTTFATYAAKLRQKGDSMLHAKQYQVAMDGNTTLLVWLGKQRLGQSDQPREKQEFNGTLSNLLSVMHLIKSSEDFESLVELSKKEEIKKPKIEEGIKC